MNTLKSEKIAEPKWEEDGVFHGVLQFLTPSGVDWHRKLQSFWARCSSLSAFEYIGGRTWSRMSEREMPAATEQWEMIAKMRTESPSSEKSHTFSALFFSIPTAVVSVTPVAAESVVLPTKEEQFVWYLICFFSFLSFFFFLLLFFIIFRVCRRCSWINWMLSGRACCNFYRLVHRMWMDCESVKEPRDNRSVYLTLMNAKTYNAPAICSLLHAPAVW